MSIIIASVCLASVARALSGSASGCRCGEGKRLVSLPPAKSSLRTTRLTEIRGSAEVLRFAVLTRDRKSSSLTRRSDGPPSKEGKAKSKFLSDSSAGIAEFPVLMEFLDPPEIASEFANQIRDPYYEGYDSLPGDQECNC